ncbi:hypothetical protein [Lederbergia citri]|uniref:Uncharacterized protein n=1 Tax=Lederbergia citri TaxID=2833580 RepID=A0A942YEU8_9BACI|nr:hypothetical protein [Lederbergia citri]MBS4194298.1 hypothetical protein [Lederbergia citri]
MKMKNLQHKLIGLIQAINRYPLTMLFLLAIATVNVNMINNETEDYLKYLFTFIVGALLSVIGQQVYERFLQKLVNVSCSWLDPFFWQLAIILLFNPHPPLT